MKTPSLEEGAGEAGQMLGSDWNNSLEDVSEASYVREDPKYDHNIEDCWESYSRR